MRTFYVINDNQVACDDNSFDVVVSVEVMEHVEDLDAYLSNISRLVKPGGYFVWTTPCGNLFSLPHIYSAFTGNIEYTKEGYRRWKWEDPTHLRRLRSKEIEGLLKAKNYSDVRFRFRAHVFSFICTHVFKRRAERFRNWLMTLDYSLFRCLPNAGSMLGGARKSINS